MELTSIGSNQSLAKVPEYSNLAASCKPYFAHTESCKQDDTIDIDCIDAGARIARAHLTNFDRKVRRTVTIHVEVQA